MRTVLISTGGSGGHVVPALNLYYHLKDQFEVKIYTDLRGEKYIPEHIERNIFEVKQIPEKKYLLPIKIIFLVFSFFKSLIHLSRNKFDILISTGGYMSFPLSLAAKVLNKKIYLFEPNSIIGRSNKLLLNFSNKIFCYDKNIKGITKKNIHKIIEISPILNKCFYNNNSNNDLNTQFLKILTIGGSQASVFLSKNLKDEIIKLAKKYKIELTMQLPQNIDINNYKKDFDSNGISSNLFYFEENFLCKNNNFDIAITRSGASSIAELAHLNIPFIAIPFPHAKDNHQYLNAKRYFDLNCCWILEEKNFNSGDIYKIINQIMVNKNEYFEKKKNIKKLNENHRWEYLNKKLIKYFNEN